MPAAITTGIIMMAIADMIIEQIITAMEINGGDGGRGDKEPSPSYYVKLQSLVL